MGEELKKPDGNHCVVVTVVRCNHPDMTKESPEGCGSCGMMEWLGAFETEKECNDAFMKQYPEQFSNGVQKGNDKPRECMSVANGNGRCLQHDRLTTKEEDGNGEWRPWCWKHDCFCN